MDVAKCVSLLYSHGTNFIVGCVQAPLGSFHPCLRPLFMLGHVCLVPPHHAAWGNIVMET